MIQNLLQTSDVDTCKNSGYNLLDVSGQSITITSDNYPSKFDKDIHCYWAFYAPDAMKLKITISTFQVH